MTTTALKKELHKAIDQIDDQTFLQAIYTIVHEHAVSYDLSEEEWQEIEEQQKMHKAGKSKSYTLAEVRKYAVSQLKK